VFETVTPGAGEFGKGSLTKARLVSPFWIWPLLKDHWDVMNEDALDPLWVTEGKGNMVLVVNEKDAATEVTGIWPVANA